MSNHRWSGWPGAWCLDCGIEDPVEIFLVDHNVEDVAGIEIPECKEPGSNRFNPYTRKQ